MYSGIVSPPGGGSGRRRSPASHPDVERRGRESTLSPDVLPRVAVDGLQTGRADPLRLSRPPRRGGRRRWRGVTEEALDGGDDRGRLLGRGGGRDDLELRAAVGHAPRMMSAGPASLGTVGGVPPESLKPRLRGVFHQWAFVVSLIAGAVLVAAAPTGRAAAVGAIYAIALAGMFGASALYHRVAWRPSLRPWFRRLDHSMIFVLIAATSTPVTVLGLKGVLPVVVLAIVWGGALLGVLLKLVWIGAPRRLVAAVYVLLGWVGVLLLPETIASVGVAPALLFAAGG